MRTLLSPEWVVPESDALKYIGGSIDEVEDRERFATPVALAEANELSEFEHDRLRLSERLSNAHFIAAANPAAILALIAEIERLWKLEGEERTW